MITLHKYEGKNKDLLKEECIKELNDAYMITSEIESGIFKGKKYVLEAITNEEIINYIRMFINDLSKKMNIEINSEIKIVDKNINVLLVSNNNNILIGKDGKTLNAIQLILRQFCKQLNKFDFKIMVDASNYKAKKIKNLEYEIKKICKEVLKTKVEVKLDPMNSFERRIVHSIVAEFEGLESISYGENPNRYTVIKINVN